MQKRMCIYLRIAWFLFACLGYGVVSDYVAQQRYVHLGFCPYSQGVPGLLIFDTLRPTLHCMQLPMPSDDKGEVAPKLPPSDKKTGV